jgi:hypothetical protein
MMIWASSKLSPSGFEPTEGALLDRRSRRWRRGSADARRDERHHDGCEYDEKSPATL